jgi:hypothetical protein
MPSLPEFRPLLATPEVPMTDRPPLTSIRGEATVVCRGAYLNATEFILGSFLDHGVMCSVFNQLPMDSGRGNQHQARGIAVGFGAPASNELAQLWNLIEFQT